MFERLLGNKKFKTELAELSKNGKIPHAVIIEGEKGLGRHIAAGYIAAAAMCENDNPPCEACNDCRLAMDLIHSDIRIFKPEKKSFTVDLAREVRSHAYIKPLTAKCNVLILENAETMNNEAQNALLKVLEEPPGTAMFILITENASLFLPTVLSRCTVMRLNPVTEEEAYSYLSTNGELTEEEIYSAIAASEGNIGKALSLIGDEEFYEYDALANDFFNTFVRNNLLDIVKLAYSLEKSSSIETVLTLTYEKFLGTLKECAQYECPISPKQAYAACDAVKKAISLIKSNVNKSLVLNTMCFELKKAREL